MNRNHRFLILFAWFVSLLVIVDLYLALIWSPPEKTMGNLIRIMYFHVSSVWIAYVAFGVTLVLGIVCLIRPSLRLDKLAACSAEIGILYTTLTLVTGMLWAKPVWNTWWTWDPRLTTTLMLWLLYVAYFLLRALLTDDFRRIRVTSIWSLIAFADIPVIHFAVEWWKSIHPQVIDETGVFMPSSMLFTLLFSFFTFLCLYILLLILRYEQSRMQTRIRELGDKVDSILNLKSPEKDVPYRVK